MELSCPFCPAEIGPETSMCPSCRTAYDLDTLKFLRILVRECSKEHPGDRRVELRVPTALEVSYTSLGEFVQNYLYNLSLGGVFIKTDAPLNPGEELSLKLFLPDDEDPLEVTGEVAWNRAQEQVTPEAALPVGMGVRFMNLSKQARQRIIVVLTSALSEVQVEAVA